MKTSELTGKALDYAVALAIYGTPKETEGGCKFTFEWLGQTDWPAGVVAKKDRVRVFGIELEYSTNWSQGGPLAEDLMRSGFDCVPWTKTKDSSEGFMFSNFSDEGLPYQEWDSPRIHEFGETFLIAAMRALVAYKLGDEVDIPDQLTKGSS